MTLDEYLQSEGMSQQRLADMLTEDAKTTPGAKPATQGAISQWLAPGRRVPADRVLQLERVSGGLMTRHELRPDFYPADDAGAGAAA